MSEFENVQRLIRLKRHEQPPPEFVEDFILEFRERQRSELLRQSARGLLWERVVTYIENSLAPAQRWAMAGAAAAAVLLAVWAVIPGTRPSNVANSEHGSKRANAMEAEVVLVAPPSRKVSVPFEIAGIRLMSPEESEDVTPGLLSQHFGGGYADEVVARDTGTAMPVDIRLRQDVDFEELPAVRP